MTFFKKKTFRSKKYLAFIKDHPCVVCGDPQTEPHHEGFGQNMMGSKPPDTHCLPLCHAHHRERHDIGRGYFYDKYFVCPTLDVIKLLTEYIHKLGE